jgi:transposase
MRKPNISDGERVLLLQYAKASPLVLIRFKSQAVLLAANQVSTAIISNAQGRSERTIILWVRDWNNRRLASLFTGHQDNTNASKLTKAQLAEIQTTLTLPPSDTGTATARLVDLVRVCWWVWGFRW